jgi:hypothetical protein
VLGGLAEQTGIYILSVNIEQNNNQTESYTVSEERREYLAK